MPREFIPCVYREEERADIAGLAWYVSASMLTIYQTPQGWELTGESHGPYQDTWEEEGYTRVPGEPSREAQRQWLRETLVRLLYNLEP